MESGRYNFLLLLLLFIKCLSHYCAVSYVNVPIDLHPQSAEKAFSHASRPWARSLIHWRNETERAFTWPVRLDGLRGRADSLPEQDMYGDIVSLGEYYVVLKVEDQLVNVQLDTGSSTLAIPLAECTSCVKKVRMLDLKRVKSAEMIKCSSQKCRRNSCHLLRMCKVCSRRTKACCSLTDPEMCGFYLQYADGSGASGALVTSQVELAGLTAHVGYGGILRATKGFENQLVGGILGMAYRSLACNPTCVLPIFDRLVQDGLIKKDVFSICTGRGGGTLTLGGTDPNMLKGRIQWAPMPYRRTRHFYDVTIVRAYVGGMLLEIPNFSNAIVDSGTTVLVVAPTAFKSLKSHFQTHYCEVPGLCMESKVDGTTWFAPGSCASLSDAQISLLPTIAIELRGGVTLHLEPEIYMLKYVQQTPYSNQRIVYRCLGISYLNGLDRLENNVILGNTVLQKYLTVYDRERNRIGFAKSQNCVSRKSEAFMPGSIGVENTDGTRGKIGKSFLLGAGILGVLLSWSLLLCLCGQSQGGRRGYSPIGTSQ